MPSLAEVDVRRYCAFTRDPAGGNPAGVVLHAERLDTEAMQAVAAAVGYSETAFVTRRERDGYTVRYFTPQVEVPFCGHATIAAAVALGEIEGARAISLKTAAGRVGLGVELAGGDVRATLRSVPPTSEPVDAADLDAALKALGWSHDDLDPRLPPRVADAGARHLLLSAAARERLSRLPGDRDDLRRVSDRLRAITVALLWREDAGTFHARNLGPSVGIAEDPATGGAAAALGGYLAELGAIDPPARLVIRQGEDMGRPSRLEVSVSGRGEPVAVTGSAVAIDTPSGQLGS